MSPDTEGRREVQRRLEELGWYVRALDIEAGRTGWADLFDPLNAAIDEKRDWLSQHTYTPGTTGEATHERLTTWCERAESLVTYLQKEATDAA